MGMGPAIARSSPRQLPRISDWFRYGSARIGGGSWVSESPIHPLGRNPGTFEDFASYWGSPTHLGRCPDGQSGLAIIRRPSRVLSQETQ